MYVEASIYAMDEDNEDVSALASLSDTHVTQGGATKHVGEKRALRRLKTLVVTSHHSIIVKICMSEDFGKSVHRGFQARSFQMCE